MVGIRGRALPRFHGRKTVQGFRLQHGRFGRFVDRNGTKIRLGMGGRAGKRQNQSGDEMTHIRLPG